MAFFKEQMRTEYESIHFKNQRRNLRKLPQKGKSIKALDDKRKALLPGKRISKTGNVYWETRKNRSDEKGKRV